ncbi:hypothetical protein FGIG_02295 [Fasciola gigantica]|uniref:Uncharacterized protein n=1 Tax=Fasciola gigantica TaxID=46835 RepID=A0A504Z497_FASGI|nr:hypothetical protein FGIG_02295 [Fasciola gigantica]
MVYSECNSNLLSHFSFHLVFHKPFSSTSVLHGCKPCPPRECQPFPVIAISQASSITPACFSRASAETRKLVVYVENLAHEARCTKVCKALDSLMNYAQIYSMLFGRNVNKFSTGRTSCSRPVLRINEAILSSISSMARVAKSLDYQMTVAGNMKCDQASQVITKTVQNYVQLLGVLMSRVTNYLCSTPRIVSNDQILMSVDNIALIFLQLAPSTAEFLKSPSRCSECAYQQSIGAFRKHLECKIIFSRFGFGEVLTERACKTDKIFTNMAKDSLIT